MLYNRPINAPRRFMALSLGIGLLAAPTDAKAQLLPAFFPEGVPGYGADAGDTVLSRTRPAYDPLGIKTGAAMVRPLLSTFFGYNDNVFGGRIRRGSWEAGIHPSILIGMDQTDASYGLYLSADDVRYVDQPSQNHTGGAVFLGATKLLGRDKATIGAGFMIRHEDRAALDALPSDRPVAFQVANLRLSYAAERGRFTLIPTVELNQWRFNSTTVQGVPVNQSARDRTTVLGGLAVRYAWLPSREFVVETRALGTHYDHPPPLATSKDSMSWQVAGGVDFNESGIWRYRMLAGLAYRVPASPAVQPEATGIAEAEIIWSPSGLTTLRGSVMRGMEDAAQTGLFSYTYSSAGVRVDHEFAHDILLDGSITLRHASFHHTGGQQIGVGFGAGATWLINRSLRLSLAHDITAIRNSHLPAGTVAGHYTRNLTLITLRAGL